MKFFDLIVIGTGSAGSGPAYRGKKAGWKVAVVDHLPFGGTCALRGCDPKKVLVGESELVDWSRRMAGKGITGRLKVDWPRMIDFKKTFTEPMSVAVERGYKKVGIATFHGKAQFIGRNSVKVGDKILKAKHIVITAGAEPRKLNIPGENYLATSDDFLELKKLPKRIIFVGGGFISFEFAHIVARAGVKATILHRGERPLEGFDKNLVEKLVEASKKLGIEIKFNTIVKEVEKKRKRFLVRADVKGNVKLFEGDLIVHGAGRVPAIKNLNLERGDIEHDKNGIVVNDYLQSVSNSGVFAAGDVVLRPGGFPLTPVAGYEGKIVADNLIDGKRIVADYTGLSSVVFTTPPLAMAGMREEDAKKAKLKFRVSYGETSSWYSSKRVAEKFSGFKVLVEEKSGKVLGAHLLGPQSEETINIFALAIKHNLTANDLKKMLWAYPSHASDVIYML